MVLLDKVTLCKYGVGIKRDSGSCNITNMFHGLSHMNSYESCPLPVVINIVQAPFGQGSPILKTSCHRCPYVIQSPPSGDDKAECRKNLLMRVSKRPSGIPLGLLQI